MPVCPACSQDNPETARFCMSCGTALAESERPVRQERRHVSVVFVDLVGFTGRSETLDPEDVDAFLTPYHEAVRGELESFGGVVEKFIGDAVVAVFGAPTAFGDDAERAVRAALAVRDRVEEVRIAVNTGVALVNLAARPALGEAMVAGDPVNSASRLQSAAPVGGVLVGRETWLASRDVIAYERSEPVVAKGKSEPVEAWLALRPLVPAGERPVASSFVGRTRELAMLREIWERIMAERVPHLVTVLGDAGVGKTRLGLEIAAVVDALGGRTIRGRSLPYRESSAYGAFASQLKQLCHIFESDPPDVALAKLRDTVGTLLDPTMAEESASHLAILIGIASEGAVVADRETLFFSVRCFIEAVARDQPTVLVFEDLHWGDTSLLDLVELLAARLRDLPVLFLVLARPELLDTRGGWGGGLPAYTAIRLGPLSNADSELLASERLAASTGLPAERAAELARTAAGNPLFIEQLAATLMETSTPAGSRALPVTISGLLAARLDALPAEERSVLLDAAVGGKVFWRGALEKMGSGDGRLGELLGALELRDLVRRDTVSAIEGEQQFSFTHDLIRDVAYDLLPRAARRRRHEQYARFLEETTAETGEAGAALARHWREAGENGRALDYLLGAAQEAERGWAKDRAVSLYKEALVLVPSDDRERLRAVRGRLAVAQQAYMHVNDALLRLDRET